MKPPRLHAPTLLWIADEHALAVAYTKDVIRQREGAVIKTDTTWLRAYVKWHQEAARALRRQARKVAKRARRA